MLVQWVQEFANIIWGVPLQCALLGIGIYYTVRLRFIQVRRFPAMIRNLFGKTEKKDGISSFAAMTAALGGTIGVGNIVGVSAALSVGGPGALFWMIVSGFVGMATKYAEVYLAVAFRRKTENGYIGGAMVCLSDYMHCRALGILFAVLCICTSFGMGNMLQSYTASKAIHSVTGLSQAVSGGVLAVVLVCCMNGGARRITNLTKWIVPAMALFYTGGCFILIWQQKHRLSMVLNMILSCAFSPASAASGVMGYGVSRAMRAGISKGVFSNEAGMGSAPIAHATAANAKPQKQAFMGMAEVFFDTVFMCFITGVTALLWGGWSSDSSGYKCMIDAFTAGFGTLGGTLLQISLALFALTSVLGWAVYGDCCIRYLSSSPTAQKIYRIMMGVFCLLGSLTQPLLAWALADCLNGLMALPNLVVLIGLRRGVKDE